MRTTITIDDEQLETARRLTGIKEATSLVKEALTRLIQSEASRRLARLGGTDPNAKAAPRRRSLPDPVEADCEQERRSYEIAESEADQL